MSEFKKEKKTGGVGVGQRSVVQCTRLAGQALPSSNKGIPFTGTSASHSSNTAFLSFFSKTREPSIIAVFFHLPLCSAAPQWIHICKWASHGQIQRLMWFLLFNIHPEFNVGDRLWPWALCHLLMFFFSELVTLLLAGLLSLFSPHILLQMSFSPFVLSTTYECWCFLLCYLL